MKPIIHLTAGYIDPGTGSLVLQAIAGGVAAVAVTARLYWRRLKAFFRRPEEETTST